MFVESVRKFAAIIVVGSVLLIGTPTARAQDVITADDFSGGASVYTFRDNRRAKKKTAAVKKGYVPRKNIAMRTRARTRLRSQIAAARTRSNRPRFKPVDPATVAKTTPKTVAAKAKLALDVAGAGETYLDGNDSQAAVSAFERSLALNPKYTDAKLGLSEAYGRQGDDFAEADRPLDAMAAYQNAIKNDPKNAAAYAGLGSLYESQDNRTLAVANYEKALASDPQIDVHSRLGVLYYENGDVAKSETHLKAADGADSRNAETKLYLGLVSLKQNDADRAVQTIDEALKIDPNYADAYYFRGAANNRRSADDQAVGDYQKAVFIDATYTDAAFDMATTQYNQEKFGAAAEGYQRVVATDGTYGDAHANLAETYRQLEDFPKANAQYGVAAEYVKDDPDLYSNWGFCLGKENKWDRAGERLETAVKMRGEAADYSNVGWAYNRAAEDDAKAGRTADAALKLEKGRDAAKHATERDPSLASGFVNLGTSLNGLQDYENASLALRRAVDLKNDWYFAHNELGRSLRGLGRLAEAIASFQRVVSLNDKFAYGLFNLGEAQFASGDKKGAEKTMKTLRKLDSALAGRLDGVLKGKIDEQKRKAEDKVKEKTVNKIPKLPF